MRMWVLVVSGVFLWSLRVMGSDPVVGGLSKNDVIIANETGLEVARLEIDGRRLEAGVTGNVAQKILVEVSPARHHFKVVFRGGSDVDWPHLDFGGIHEIFLERRANHIDARIQ